MFIKYYISLFFVLEGFSFVNCQICSKRNVVISTSREAYLSPYVEKYKTKCWYGSCTKTRMNTVIKYRDVSRRNVQTVKVCCDGYIKDDSIPDSGTIVCKPICMPSCLNGYCKDPGECACNDGYAPDPMSSHRCLPRCSQSCDHGSCVAPETCQCNFGYVFNKTCNPICTEPCENGKCTAPDTCECYEGYRMSESNACEPYCSQGCEHGSCTHPENCTCDEGYKLVDNKCTPICKDCGNGSCTAPGVCECDPGYTFEHDTCVPYCPYPCVNGICVAPFTCVCNPGYASEFEICVPRCSNECGNGRCIAPETCECAPGYIFTNSCDPTCCKVHCSKPCIHGTCIEPDVCDCEVGYKMDFNLDTCVPDCPFDCGQGKCVAPNICECFPGYNESYENKYEFDKSVCEPICKNCEGNCVEPYNCVCDLQYETKHEALDGGECNCFKNCTDTSKPCERTICLLKSTIRTTEAEYTSFTEEEGSFVDDGLIDYESGIFQTGVTENRELMYSEEYSSFTEDINVAISNETVEMNVSKEQKGTKQWSSYTWIYVAVGLILLLIAIMVAILIIKRKPVIHFLRGDSYDIEDKHEEDTSSHSMGTMRLSTIEGHKRDSYG